MAGISEQSSAFRVDCMDFIAILLFVNVAVAGIFEYNFGTKINIFLELKKQIVNRNSSIVNPIASCQQNRQSKIVNRNL